MDHDPSLPPPPPPSSSMSPPPPGDAPGPRLPWEERQQRGFVDALVETIRLLVTAPRDAYRRLRQDGDLTSPILYAVIVGVVGQLFSVFWQMFVGSPFDMYLKSQGLAAATGFGIVQGIVTIILTPFIVVICLFIAAGIYHLALHLLGGLDRSSMGFEGSLKVTAYAWTAGLANVIPFLGVLVTLVGSIILLVIGLTEAHRTDQNKAIIAVLIPLVLCCVCAMAVMFLFGAALFAGLAANG